MMVDLKTEFHKRHDEAKGSRERLKYYAEKCVQAHNEAMKWKALGRPGLDSKLAAKKKKNKSANAARSSKAGKAKDCLPCYHD